MVVSVCGTVLAHARYCEAVLVSSSWSQEVALSSCYTRNTDKDRLSLLAGNSLYLLALNYYFIITFLGYNALPFLHHTELLLVPVAVCTILWITSLFLVNLPIHLAPVRWAGVKLLV